MNAGNITIKDLKSGMEHNAEILSKSYMQADKFTGLLKQEALFNILNWMLKLNQFMWI